MLWLPSRLRGCIDTVMLVGVGAWLAYGSWDLAVAHQTEAIILGSLLAASFVLHAASLAAGLLFGGAWREFPEGLSWSFVQKLEVAVALFHAACLSHYSRLIGRAASTPVWCVMYFSGVQFALISSLCDANHCLAVRELILIHHSAVFAYEVMTTPGWSDPERGGKYRCVEYVFAAFMEMFLTHFVAYFSSLTKGEATRLRDMQVHAAATLQRDVTLNLVTNYLPPSVLLHVQERAAIGNAADIIAWKFTPGCVLQSDIVGFTALGSRISPEQLCRYGRLSLAGKRRLLRALHVARSFCRGRETKEICVIATQLRCQELITLCMPPLRSFLHDLFTHFDELVARFKVNKIETVGDAYIAAAGCVVGECGTLEANARALACLALEMQTHCATLAAPDGSSVVMRIGLHCGPLVGGVVGGSMLRYHLFGSPMDGVTQARYTVEP